MPLTIKKPPQTEAEAVKIAKSTLMPDGTYTAHIRDAWDDKGKKTGRDMIRATVVILDADGNDRELPLFLHTASAALLLLRHICVAVGAEAKFNAGSIAAEDISGHDVRCVVGTERKRNWPARNVILDVLPAEAEAADVVQLRTAAAGS